MDSLVGAMGKTEQEIEAERNREVARRQGRNFITIRYVGPIMPRVDTDGTVGNIRMHSVEDIEIFQAPDYANPGRTKLEQKIVNSIIKFRSDSVGDVIADVLDTELNRNFLAKNKDCLAVTDPKIAAEIELLVSRKYTVEPSEEEAIKRRMASDQRRLEEIRSENARSKRNKRNKELEQKLNKDIDAIGDEEIPAAVDDDEV